MFNNKTGLQNVSSCTPCSPGFYCIPGTISPNLKCQAGYWCKGGSYKKAPDKEWYGIRCPNGSYCPAGIAEPQKCPKGTYQPEEGKTILDDCKGK